jgi:prepilin-type N-terminal cleavage/methylation domain-containing protein
MNEPSSESGFSLVELLVAMTITLIVSGAIYGLMTGGQNAFRREPELAERQQNIRLAMDMMVRDLANAGTGLPPFTQVFTQGLGAFAASPVGPSGAKSDDLELLTVSGRESEPVCTGPDNGSFAQASLVRGAIAPAVATGTLAFLVFTSGLTTPVDDPPAVHDDMWTVRRVTGVGVSSPTPPGTLTWSQCATTGVGTAHGVLLFAGVYPENAPTTLCQNSPVKPFGNLPLGSTCGTNVLTRVVFGRQVRYQVRNDTDGVPVLQRISSDDPNATPQVLARGIEELQVEYTQFSTPGTWLPTAPAAATPANETWAAANAANKFGTIVDRVRLTLTSRSEARNIFGATNRADGTDPRIRGSLSATVSPRAALLNVSRGRPSPDPGGYWE